MFKCSVKAYALGCGVTQEMLTGKRIFLDVFPDFLSWINRCVNEAAKGASKLLYPGEICAQK